MAKVKIYGHIWGLAGNHMFVFHFLAIKQFFPDIWQILTLKNKVMANVISATSNAEIPCLDQYVAPNSQKSRGECPQQMEVNAPLEMQVSAPIP